jgi:predicted DNA-binding protein with PD1-like motif
MTPAALAARLALCAALSLIPALAGAAEAPVPPGYLPQGAPATAMGPAPRTVVTQFGPQPMRAYKITLHEGDDLVAGINAFMATHRLKQASLSGIGGFSTALLSWYDPAVRLHKKNPVDQKTEVVSFVGTIATDAKGEPRFHAHVVLALSDGTTRGGHLVSATVAPIMEVFVTDLGEGQAAP